MVWEKGKEKEKRGGNSLGLTLTQGRVEEGNGGEGKGRCGDLLHDAPGQCQCQYSLMLKCMTFGSLKNE